MNFIKNQKSKIIVLLGVVLFVYWYFQSNRMQEASISSVVVEQVERGDVTSGIETTGKIVAAQKLDLDVYKQIARIDEVNVINGGKIVAGDVLISFDASDVLVEVESSRVGVIQAELTLENEILDYVDPNTAVRTLESDIRTLQTEVSQAEVDKNRVYRTYLNADLEPVPGNKSVEDEIRPTISGLYSQKLTGEYIIDVYRSGTDLGYSYSVSGLESDITSVLLGFPTPIGKYGLEITFEGTPSANDLWKIAVPNTYAPEYVSNLEVYEEAISELDLFIAESQVTIANKEHTIEDLLQNDSTQFRDLGVARARAELAQAREQLSQNFDVVQEQNIVAPFSGTVEGMENVVVGASPTRDTNDPITLGILISDDFLATFSLSAVDIAKVEVGQRVLVSVTSFPEAPTLEAVITEISSLPNSEGVAQYEVQAFITLPSDLPITLREGLLADIEIVEDVANDVLRIPSAAISYENRQAQVRVLADITSQQQETIDTLSIIRNVSGEQVGFTVDVQLGVNGAFYTEVTSGLTQGQYLVVGDTDSTESALSETGPRGRPNNN
ncbi:MAG: multidrug efflux pump subunit AcrA (membrane-fusion protein) [Acidimicrobiales bacterium]|jgi:multidrug efflux pump subunit AcrA (membrane-fusion protein)